MADGQTTGPVDLDQLRVLRELRRMFGARNVKVLKVEDNPPEPPRADQLQLDDEGGDAA